MTYPALFLKKNEDKRIRQGHVWVFSNEVDSQRSPLEQFTAGDFVLIHDSAGKALAIAYINPNALICARILSRKTNNRIGVSFFKERLIAALTLRERLFAKPYYRMVFAESDGLPGLVIDRFDQVLSVQITTAGMEKQQQLLLDILIELLAPQAIVLKNDNSQRQLEGLSLESELVYGQLPTSLIIEENNAQFQINILDGQKTGWFYDHRYNRVKFAAWSKDLKVLDLFSYAGGWGIQSALAGASSVTCVDSSELALSLAANNSQLNHVGDKMQFVQSDVFEFLKQQREQNIRYDAIVLDPPALIKRKKDFKAGFEAYRRLNHLALQVLDTQGLLVTASCSFHLSRDNLHEIVRSSARHIDRHCVILAEGGQAADHPIHPAVPESDYLKSFFCAVSARI